MSRQHHSLSDILSQEPASPSIWPRRVFHVLGGSIMPTFILFAPAEPLGWGFIIACAVVVSGEVAWGLLPWVNDLTIRYLPFFKAQERYEVTGSTFLVLSSTLVFFIFDKEIAALALYCLAIGDPLAALVGRKDPRFRVFGKSLVGSLAFALSASAIGYAVAVHPDIPLAWWIVPGAMIAAAAEILPLPLDDNITIPMAGATAMTLLALL
jgi:glycerol-3-phosphate acyltransferase PlsY